VFLHTHTALYPPLNTACFMLSSPPYILAFCYTYVFITCLMCLYNGMGRNTYCTYPIKVLFSLLEIIASILAAILSIVWSLSWLVIIRHNLIVILCNTWSDEHCISIPWIWLLFLLRQWHHRACLAFRFEWQSPWLSDMEGISDWASLAWQSLDIHGWSEILWQGWPLADHPRTVWFYACSHLYNPSSYYAICLHYARLHLYMIDDYYAICLHHTWLVIIYGHNLIVILCNTWSDDHCISILWLFIEAVTSQSLFGL